MGMTKFQLKMAEARLADYQSGKQSSILGLSLKQASSVLAKLEKDFEDPDKVFLRTCDYRDIVTESGKYIGITEQLADFFLDVMIAGVTEGGNIAHTYVRDLSFKEYPEAWV